MTPSTATENADRGPAIVGILWTEAAISLIITALRFYARGMIRKVGWDDWLMALTTVRSLLFASDTAALVSLVYSTAQFLVD